MNPDELEKLLKALLPKKDFRHYAGKIADMLDAGTELAGGHRTIPTDLPQERRTIGRADPRNVPVSADELAALPRARTSATDKVIGGASDFTPVASAEALRQSYHNAKAGKYGTALLGAAMAALDLVPGAGAEERAARKAFTIPEKYAILTAENPAGQALSAARNAQLNRALEKHLTRESIPFSKVLGAYTDETSGQALKENSYLLDLSKHAQPEALAERIGRQFGQNGVVTHAGYHNLAEGKLHPTSGLSDATGDIYTELPDGRRVISNIDWEKNNPLMEAAGDSVAAAPTSLAGVAMRHKRSGKVYSIDGFDGGHGAVWANVQNERGPMTWQDRDHLFEDGFTTSDGRFVNRADALEIAKARHVYNGQERARLEPDGRPGLHTEAIEDPNPPYRKAFETHADFQARRGEGAVPRNIAQADSVAVDWAAKHVLAKDNDAAVSRFKSTAQDIRAFPDQRRNDLIDALRGEAYMRPNPYDRAPAVITRDRYRPTSRGVFPRDKGAELYREPAPLEFTAQAKPKSTGLHPVAEQIANDPRVIQRILADVEKGRDMGGLGWYGLKELRDFIESEGGPFSFRDVNMAGAAGSARTPTHNELTNMSLNLFGRKRGLDTEEARQVYLWMHPGTMRPTYMNTHRQIFDRGMTRGVMGPNNPADGALKIPHYFHNRQLGATGIPIDTHEQRMLSQATGISMDDIKKAMAAGGNNYDAMTQPYHRVAEMLGMTPDQVQASRWLGGGLQTGLKSQPKGDFLQTLEDGLLYTQRVRGKDESPQALRNLFGRIVRGDDFFMPSSTEGGFPVY